MSSIKDITEDLNITRQTYYNWKTTKPKLVEIIERYYNKDNSSNINGHNIVGNSNTHIIINGNNVESEIMKALSQLPEKKKKLYYHKIMADLLESENE